MKKTTTWTENLIYMEDIGLSGITNNQTEIFKPDVPLQIQKIKKLKKSFSLHIHLQSGFHSPKQHLCCSRDETQPLDPPLHRDEEREQVVFQSSWQLVDFRSVPLRSALRKKRFLHTVHGVFGALLSMEASGQEGNLERKKERKKEKE